MATCDTCGRSESKEVKFYETSILLVCVDCATDHFLRSNPELTPKPLSFTEQLGYSTKDIYMKLSKSVIGQDKAKKTLAVALMNHMKRITVDRSIEKTNVLLIGSTGTGKTQLAKELAEITSLPLGIVDANSITGNGWSGDDPESVLVDLYQKADGDVEKAQVGIVFIDEIDKLAKDQETRYESMNGQRGLLKILEGAVVGIPVGKEKRVFLDTSHILFICAGAFSGIQKIVDSRKTNKGIGFGAVVDKEDFKGDEVTTEDLEKYGFMPEFLGRIPARTRLDDLSQQDLRQILTKENNSLVSQYTRMFELDGIKLSFSSTGLEEIAKQAVELKTGARGLKTILEKVLFDYQFEHEEPELYITGNIVLKKLGLSLQDTKTNEIQSSHNRRRSNSI